MITPMRLDAIQAFDGVASNPVIMESKTIVRQRSCAAFEVMIARAKRLKMELPAVVAGLRAAQPQLSPTCVAPARDPADVSRASTVLGKSRATAASLFVEGALTEPAQVCTMAGARPETPKGESSGER